MSKRKELKWAEGTSEGTKKGREEPIKLRREYKIKWKKYSDLEELKEKAENIILNTNENTLFKIYYYTSKIG